MKTIRASEIGSFVFCNRAWSYQRQGVESINKAELAAGTDVHQHHSQAVVAAGILRGAAVLVLLGGIILLAVYLTLRIL